MSKLIDLTGQDFGYWHVIERAPNNARGKAYWRCICTNCGKEKNVSGTHLRLGNSTNCGCVRMEKMRLASIKDETGKQYGFLKVKRIATKEEQPRTDRTGVYWVCDCEKCGRKNIIIFGDYLRNGDTKSCGCINSFNESKICQMLSKLGIKFIQQKRFENLTSTGRECDQLMFDIAVYNQNTLIYIIEYDGVQHFEEGHFNGSLEITRKNDLLKNKYCFDNNIPLIRIPYNAEYTLADLKLETTRFLLTPDNEKKYYSQH